MSRALTITLALSLASTGCFTSWVTTQATGTQRVWDEGSRDVAVPQPGATEHLAVGLPLTTTGNRVELACTSYQRAIDEVHHSAFRYGKRFKLLAATAFLLEGAVAATYLLTADAEHDANYVYGGALAIDALGTAAMLVFPRKEVFTRDPRTVTTELTQMCPDGLVLDVGGDTFVVDAAGGIGELGDAALDAWMAEPSGPLLVSFGGRTSELRVGPQQQCTWRRSRDASVTCYAPPGQAQRAIQTSIELPLGTMTVATRR